MREARATPRRVSRRGVLKATAAGALASLVTTKAAAAARGPAPLRPRAVTAAPVGQGVDPEFRRLDEMIREAMERYDVPGLAVGVLHEGREYTNGYGVANLNAPLPVDATTLFQTGSVTKTYTATLIMRLVDMGKVDLDAPVRRYLPDLRLADDVVAEQVTVRQLLNHTAGWFGDYYGPLPTALEPAVWPWRGDDALSRYVANMQYLPQLAPLGAMFGYNNAAVVLAGHLAAVVAGTTYEAALTELLLRPLGMDSAYLFPEETIPYPVAAGHVTGDDGGVTVSPLWALGRCVNPTGGLTLPITDQLKYARFHLGDGRAADGTPLLAPSLLTEMRTARSPGMAAAITANAEIYGGGVGWALERIAGVQIVTHNGGTVGQAAVLALVPERQFAIGVFANARPAGEQLHYEISTWALAELAGLSQPLPPTYDLPAARLAEYVGRYGVDVDVPGGGGASEVVEVAPDGGGLKVTVSESVASEAAPADEPTPSGPAARLAFFRDDAVLVTSNGHTSLGADFVRDDSGRVRWFRWGARIVPRLD
ncbi:MAG TPA: serine hydrolase domain-containing protein [Chloroflexota bacterium]|nr:serine hydrolase domain-containing protein [Chloroflexota bacterium]